MYSLILDYINVDSSTILDNANEERKPLALVTSGVKWGPDPNR
jgi:hypothetical protein